MLRFTLAALLLVGSALSAQAIDLSRYYVSTTDQDEDWAPGEGGDLDLPSCDYMIQAADGSCEITPETRLTPPVEAPDGCIMQMYYDDWEYYVNYGCG